MTKSIRDGHPSILPTPTLLPVCDLRINPTDARHYGDESIEMFAVCIKEFGPINPIVVDDIGMLVCGKRRIAGARRQGRKTVPIR